MRLFDALKGVGKVISFHAKIARKLKSNNACIFLEQLIYWTGKEKGKDSPRDGWIYKSTEKIYKETNLTYKEQIAVREILKKAGILEEFYKRLEHKQYYKINIEGLNDWWERKPDKTPHSPDMTKGDLGNSQDNSSNLNNILTNPPEPAINLGISRHDKKSFREMTLGKVVYTESTNTIILKEEESACARINLFLKEDWRPSTSMITKIQERYFCTDNALQVCIREFISFYTKNKMQRIDWDKAFEQWCANRKSWKEDKPKSQLITPMLPAIKEQDPYIQQISIIVTEKFKKEFNDEAMKWISDLQIHELREKTLILTASTKFIHSWVKDNYLQIIEKVIKNIDDNIESLSFLIRRMPIA